MRVRRKQSSGETRRENMDSCLSTVTTCSRESDRLAPLAGRAQAAFSGRSDSNAEARASAMRAERAAGEGDYPRTELVESPPHPDCI